MADRTINDTLRSQAWERAKGELRSILVTLVDDDHQYKLASEEISAFIANMEAELWPLHPEGYVDGC